VPVYLCIPKVDVETFNLSKISGDSAYVKKFCL